MTPVYGRSIEDGTYDIEMESSSSFFSIYACKLTVKGGRMKAVMTIDSTSYKCVYMGKAVDAAKAPEKDYIFADEKDARGSFTIPVEALNTPIPCAAFSKKEKQWYDRDLLIDASSLPFFNSDQMLKAGYQPPDRVALPITDPEAHATYWIACLASEQQKYRSVFSAVRGNLLRNQS
jgi:hypothetical protein